MKRIEVNLQTGEILELDLTAGEIQAINDRAPLALQEAKNSKISQCKFYLSSTDWYAIRKADNGTAIPSEIETNRELARSLQQNINNCENLAELNDIILPF
jgi:hypothetical protein